MERLQAWNRLRLVLAEIDALSFGTLESQIPSSQRLTEIKLALLELSEEEQESFVTAPSHNSPVALLVAREVFNLDTDSEDSNDSIVMQDNSESDPVKLESPVKSLKSVEMESPKRPVMLESHCLQNVYSMSLDRSVV
jgi:hypothetical protein